jgi:hypothetical protein
MPRKIVKPGAMILASTFGWDVRDMSSYRYQSTTRTKGAIYAIGQQYFTVSATKPTSEGLVWREYGEQFWAKQYDATIWVASCEEEKP